jgi:hypothetical protein
MGNDVSYIMYVSITKRPVFGWLKFSRKAENEDEDEIRPHRNLNVCSK